MKSKNLLIITIILLSFVLINCGKDTSKNESTADKSKDSNSVKKQQQIKKDEIVVSISKYRAEEEKKLAEKVLKKKTVDIKTSNASEDTKQKWEKFDAYYDGDKLVRIQVYPHKGISERTEEYYLMDGKLVFVFIQDKGSKNEGKDSGEPGKEFYFDNGNLIKFVNNTGREELNPEESKIMYESKLQIEVTELIAVLNGTK
ncbi:MAG: hypothetical protein PHN88_01240 [Ignavibacteria bacterium]|nr:hypothetical protein [Ignavibacteria bacterium]